MSIFVARSRIALNLAARPTAGSRLSALTWHLSGTRPATPALSVFSPARKMASLPSTMKAVVVKQPGGADKLGYTESQPLPKLSDGQVLVKNDIAGINYIDTYFRSGLYPADFPLIVGQEAAGEIAAIEGSNPTGHKVGDRVVWLARGGYAEYTAVPGDKAITIPSGVSDEDALGAFLMGMTALSLIQEAYPVKSGETVLVHAAAGGVGLLLCQMLKDIGATVIGTAGGAEKGELAKKNGATHTIDYRATSGPSWVDQVKELTNGKGVDVVFDSVGKDTWEGSLEAVKRKGKVVYFGNASGPVPPLQIQRLAQKNVSIMRATLMQYVVERSELEYYANEVLEMVKSGKLNVKVHKTYPLKDAVEAHQDLEGRKTTGKLFLKL